MPLLSTFAYRCLSLFIAAFTNTRTIIFFLVLAMASLPSHHHTQTILAIPYPLHGHIAPMLHLCTKLAAFGFSISFVYTERHLPYITGLLSRYPPTLDIHLLSLPDDLPRDFQFTSLQAVSHFLQSVENLRWAFENLMRLQLTPIPVCILSDVHVGWTQDLATKLQLPRIALWTSNASECQVYFQASRLISQGLLPFKGTVTDLTVPIPIPGLPPLAPREFPSFLQMEDAGDICFSFFINQTKRIPEADMVLVNSFLELENSVFDALRDGSIKVFPFGPLFLLDGAGADERSGLSPDEDRCFTWLDSQAANSVLYAAFGTTVPLTCAQIASVALGLERIEQPFLWALGSATAHEVFNDLPDGFIDRTTKRGLVVSWAPQLRVLRHPSVGGFLTHCGWNSALESLTMGVPMICSPMLADQTLTCKMLVEEWKVGLRFSEDDGGFAKEGEMAKLARELFCEEKGKELRERVRKLGDAARRAMGTGGESLKTLGILIEKLKR